MLTRLPILHQTLLRQIDEQAALLGFPAYLVGGGVRDILLGLPALDLDIVLEGDAIQAAQSLKDRHGGALTLHTKFCTATWQPPEGPPLDLITARRETYRAPASLPEVSPSNLADDLARRDFSINTLALRLADEALIDLHNAQTDLAKGILRVLHPKSFHDDPTRLYRAVRYETRYRFQLASDTLALIPAALPLVQKLTAERLRHELDLVFNEHHPVRALARMDELGLLNAILEDVLPWDISLARSLDTALAAPPPSDWGLALTYNGQPLNRVLGYALWFSRLAPAQINLLHERLTFPLAVLHTALSLSTLMSNNSALAGAKPSVWVRRLEETPRPAIYAAHLLTSEPAIKQYITEWQHIHPQTDGHTLKQLNLPPGPRYAEILSTLRAAWLDGEIHTAEQEKALLTSLLS